MSSGFTPCCCRFSAVRSHAARCASMLDQRLRQRELRLRRAAPASPGPSARASILRFSSSLQVRLDFGAQVVDVAARDAERRARTPRRAAARCGSATSFTVSANSRVFPRLPCRDSRRGTCSANVFVSPAFMPGDRGLELGQHPAFAEHDREVLAPGRPGTATPSIVPVKSTVTRSPVCAPRVDRRRNVARCLRRISSVRSTSAARHFDAAAARSRRRRRRRSVTSG